MAIKPDITTLNATSPQILNAVRNEIGGDYESMVPLAANTTDSIRAIGTVIMNYQPLQNAFLSALVNRIGRVMVNSKLYENPWASFKKGLLEYGETIEEIFVNLAKPHEFNQLDAEDTLFKREIPDVRAKFHTMNYVKFYMTTVSNDQLRQAFLSWDGITDLIGKIIDTLYTGANYDEFVTMKYLVAKMALSGTMKGITIPAVQKSNMEEIVTTIKSTSNQLEYLSTEYNLNGVSTFTKKDDQFIIVNADFDAAMDVQVLASAFNMDKAQFMGHRKGVDSFAKQDLARLDLLFAEDPSYTRFTQAELDRLKTIPAILIDRDWFMIFDHYYNMTEQYNAKGLYWNYFYHVWKTFSVSPFANGVLFTTENVGVTSITIDPATATAPKNSALQFKATVVTTGFATKGVQFTVSGQTSSATLIDDNGLLRIGANEEATTLKVVATALGDQTKFATATITIS